MTIRSERPVRPAATDSGGQVEGTVQWLWATVMAAGVGIRLQGLLNVGAPLALPTVPSVVRTIWAKRSVRWPRVILVAYSATVILMPLMSVIGLLVDPARTFDSVEFAKDLIRLGSLGLVICGVFWACTKARVEWVLSMVAVGIAARYLLFPDVTGFDLFKFRLGPTLPFIVLAMVARAPRPVQAAALGGVALMSAYFNLRASLVAAAIGAIALAFSMLIPRLTRSRQQTRGTTAGALLLTGLAVGLGALTVPQMAEEGVFGTAIQQRQISQDTSGVGIFGARIEPGASTALAAHQPVGLGPGVMPSETDRQEAWGGLLRLGVDPQAGDFYATYMREMMQGRIFLHSNLAEFWWHYGVPGALFIGLIGVFMAMTMVGQLARSDPSLCGLVLYVSARSIWDCLFEPVLPIGTNLMVATGVLLWLHIQRQSEPGRVNAGRNYRPRHASAPTPALAGRSAPPRTGWRDA